MSKDTLQDGRIPGFYIVDNELIDDYGAIIGVYGIAVYNVLAKYANENGSNIFPSYQTIADTLDISRPKVISTIKILVDAGLVRKTARFDSAGDMTSNHYVLVNIKGGKPCLPPSQQGSPPSQHRKPRVVNDVNQGGKPRLPDQDPINKTQLNNTDVATQADAIAQPPLLPVGPSTEEAKPTPEPKPVRESKSKPEKSPEDKALSDLTKAILNAYVDARGKNGVHYAKEGVAAKKLAKEGRTPELVLNCYLWLKQKPFWADKVLPLIKVCEELPEYEKAKGQPGMVIPVSPSGKSKPVGTVLSKAENLR